MITNEENKFYVVPLIGGILCNFALIGNNIMLSFSIFLGYYPFSLLILLLAFGPVILDAVLGALMIVSAVKLKHGKAYWFEEKRRLLIIAGIAIGVSMGLSLFSLLLFGSFFFFHEPGLAGGLIVLLGYFFHNLVSKREFWFGPPLVIESKAIKPKSTIVSSSITGRKFCTNCGIRLEQATFRFCPNCGHQLAAK